MIEVKVVGSHVGTADDQAKGITIELACSNGDSINIELDPMDKVVWVQRSVVEGDSMTPMSGHRLEYT